MGNQTVLAAAELGWCMAELYAEVKPDDLQAAWRRRRGRYRGSAPGGSRAVSRFSRISPASVRCRHDRTSSYSLIAYTSGSTSSCRSSMPQA